MDRHPNKEPSFALWSGRSPWRFLLALLAFWLVSATSPARAADPSPPLRIAVYDVPPYGYVDTDGSIVGVSVDLWRRIAEEAGLPFKLIPVAEMETILGGLEQGRYDAAIGAITITPARSARVDFSVPAHRSGVAVALRRESGPFAALVSYADAVSELGVLILALALTMLVTGVAMWIIEKPSRAASENTESSVVTLRDGLYWAIVTMTTVGYGDKTPKTPFGRIIAILWMLGSVGLVSFISTSLVSRLTAERVETRDTASGIDLAGVKLAAVAHSSGAEYLDEQRLPYTKFNNLPEALDSLSKGEAGAVVNSVGALQYFVAKHYSRRVRMPQGLLAPAYMAIALPESSDLRRRIDRALIKIVNEPEWRSLEDKFFVK
jgi:polar amino acid transport system substrate-binding protein